nr:MAG TPA: hypothetical protein [Caudoviricetes sp.]
MVQWYQIQRDFCMSSSGAQRSVINIFSEVFENG